MPTPIIIVTTTTRPETTQKFWSSWVETAIRKDLLSVIVVVNGPNHATKAEALPGHELEKGGGQRGQLVIRDKEYLGTMPAFARGCANIPLNFITACFHDDLQILERGWDDQLRDIFSSSRVGLAGFGGAASVGEPGMYDHRFNPMSLACRGLISNTRDAEKHGDRFEEPCQVAVLDGFSQCFSPEIPAYEYFASLVELGIIHHTYGVALGCMMKRVGLETWFVPVSCQHTRGQTAAQDPGYQEWAKEQCPAGDHGLWWHAHGICYNEFSDVLPFGA